MALNTEKKGLPRWNSIKLQAQTNVLTVVDKILRISKEPSRKLNEEQATVIVGPVIGKVTSTTARILIEIDRKAQVTVTLKEQAHSLADVSGLRKTQSMFINLRRKSSPLPRELSAQLKEDIDAIRFPTPCEVEKEVDGKRPTIFEFTDLTPGTRYKVEVRGCISPIPSSFSTLPEKPSAVANLAVVSCNKIFITQKAIPLHSDLWSHLSKCIEAGKVDLVIHLGDQIYGDGDKMMDAEVGPDRDKWSNRFKMAESMLCEVPKEQWKDHREAIYEKYREVYRETWQHLPTAKCLANCPNLMIYDDHEIRDNWGDLEEDWEADSLHSFIAHCAWTVSLEYQRQLHEDVNISKLQEINKDHHFHVIGGLGLMFLDIRGSRTFHRKMDDKKKYLGSIQWNDIIRSLEPGGLFDNVRVLIVCSPAPLVFLEQTITNAAANNVRRLVDFKGHWSANLHVKEQVEMIECLSKWKSSSPKREVFVLGGDVHCGGHSEIVMQHQVLFHQLTTSAIANMPLPKSAYYFLRAAGILKNLNGEYTFTHRHWTRSRNYGLLQIKNYREKDAQDVEIIAQLVKGKFMSGIKMGVKVSNIPAEKTPGCCCAR